MNKPTKRILTGGFFISLWLWGSIFFFFPQEMTNEGLQKMLKENDNVYYLSNVKEKELPCATFSSQKRINNNTLEDNSFVPMVSYTHNKPTLKLSLMKYSFAPMVSYTPLNMNVSGSNAPFAGMPNYSSRALLRQNVLTSESEAKEGNIGVGLIAVLSSGRHSNSNQSKRYVQSFSVNLVEPFSNNTPTTLNRAPSDGGGGTDPGGDPSGPPIPVDNGIVFLILLAVGYGSVKKNIFKKLFLQRIT